MIKWVENKDWTAARELALDIDVREVADMTAQQITEEVADTLAWQGVVGVWVDTRIITDIGTVVVIHHGDKQLVVPVRQVNIDRLKRTAVAYFSK